MISEMHELCQWDTFNATCPRGSVVVMESAHYGRMGASRCLPQDDFLGCSADVIRQVDGRCSGRPSCVISFPDKELYTLSPCRSDMAGYFRASYKCVQGNLSGMIYRLDSVKSGASACLPIPPLIFFVLSLLQRVPGEVFVIKHSGAVSMQHLSLLFRPLLAFSGKAFSPSQKEKEKHQWEKTF